MLLDGPLSHLVERSSQEDVPSDALGLNTESDPGASLPKIVCRADLIEAPAVRDIALCSARLAQVFQDEMGLEVQELKHTESCRGSVEKVV